MNFLLKKNCLVKSFYFLFFVFNATGINAQNRQLVWSDEFNEPTINSSIWNFERGQTNDNVHYYTDRSDNAQIVDGKLHIIALSESYEGYSYTSAQLTTKQTLNWKYGRVEARIKLPGTSGFVPAFWMMPADDIYGWWPLSGEIDIMEHPTNEVSSIYGTVHSEAYSSFTGTAPRGASIQIPSAETEFHIYAVEWTEEGIEFFVDDQKYFTFSNDDGSSDTWPFNQPFYIILNLAVGGGWVGNPTENSLFPAVMEIDYVRVFQYLEDASINGAEFVLFNSRAVPYTAPNIAGASYEWGLPEGAEIVSGRNTNEITVDWGIFGGTITSELTTGDGIIKMEYPVNVSPNYIKNGGFENGVKFWTKSGPYPAEADFRLESTDVHNGDYSLYVDVKTPGNNTWDAQLSQPNLMLNAGTEYIASFWAKTDDPNSSINAAVINSSNFSLYSIQTITLSDTWTQYELKFTAPSTASAAFNIDMGGHTGRYYFDDFVLAEPGLTDLNQIKNADFSDGDVSWNFNAFWPAEATGSVVQGEYAVSITNGGNFVWDIYLGQSGLTIENGKEYTVSFDAYAAEPREISALVGKNSDPWNVYSGSQIISLTTTKQTYTYSFIMNEPTDNLARLGFDIGVSSSDVYFDNVVLGPGEIPSKVTGEKSTTGTTFHLLQNYPNPFNAQTTINYILYEAADVTLKIFSVDGREITTLVNSFQQDGEHHVIWNAEGLSSGIYLYQLNAFGLNEMKKLILLK